MILKFCLVVFMGLISAVIQMIVFIIVVQIFAWTVLGTSLFDCRKISEDDKGVDV